MKKFLPGVLFFLFLLTPKTTFAKIEITKYNSQIEINKDFSVEVLLTNISDSHYIGIGVHKEEGKEYFGLTKNNDNWVEMEDENCAGLPLVTINDSSWSGQLVGKIVYGEKGFDNSLGDYILKIIKYTQASCNGSRTKTDSDGVSISLMDLNPPTPTPSETPTPSKTPTPAPQNTTAPANTPTIQQTTSFTVTPLKTPTPKTTPKPTIKLKVSGEEKKTATLSAKKVKPTITGTVKGAKTSSWKKDLPKILIIFGILSVGAMVGTSFFLSKVKV